LILITTSDYFPKLGGLSTFTNNVEMSLKELGLQYDVFHWNNFNEIQSFDKSRIKKYQLIINIHSHFCIEHEINGVPFINFIHGSESLFTSPHLIKKFIKKIYLKKYFKKCGSALFNVFVSEATFKKMTGLGFRANYSRDLVIHNAIKLKDEKFIRKYIDNEIIFTCIVRDVPHKNIMGTVAFCEFVKKITGKSVTLILPAGLDVTSQVVTLKFLENSENEERDRAYQSAHFNLLFSLDFSKKGFFEGFGLTVLEAGAFGTPSLVLGTGGLPEAVHHDQTGWVFSTIDQHSVEDFFKQLTPLKYYNWSENSYKHTHTSHSLDIYKKLFLIILENQKKVA
jgi:glycosyltransferase involved in cell wall biosynthesis